MRFESQVGDGYAFELGFMGLWIRIWSFGYLEKAKTLGGHDVNDLISSGWFLGITVSDRQFMVTGIDFANLVACFTLCFLRVR